MSIWLKAILTLIVNLPSLISLLKQILTALEDNLPKDQHKDAIVAMKEKAKTSVSPMVGSLLVNPTDRRGGARI